MSAEYAVSASKTVVAGVQTTSAVKNSLSVDSSVIGLELRAGAVISCVRLISAALNTTSVSFVPVKLKTSSALTY